MPLKSPEMMSSSKGMGSVPSEGEREEGVIRMAWIAEAGLGQMKGSEAVLGERWYPARCASWRTCSIAKRRLF
jgi:hypothetical protein